MSTIQWAPAGTTDWVDLTPYVRDVQALTADPDDRLIETVQGVAMHCSITEPEAKAAIEDLIRAVSRWADGPCRRTRLPWAPHKHRYQMTRRGLR